jgi:hypothetical protein
MAINSCETSLCCLRSARATVGGAQMASMIDHDKEIVPILKFARECKLL